MEIRKSPSHRSRNRFEVQDKIGNVSDPYELERELPNFIEAELVTREPRLPFVDELDEGICRPSTDVNNRLNIQLSLIGTYLTSNGNLTALEHLWTNVGAFANKQNSSTDFVWDEEHLLVSPHTLFICRPNIIKAFFRLFSSALFCH